MLTRRRLGWVLLLALALTIVPGSRYLALAQVDYSGTWASKNFEDALERAAGPYAVDYAGIPLNAEGRAKALAYSQSQLSQIERQCGLWPPFYTLFGPQPMRIWNETDPVEGRTTAMIIGGIEDRAPLRIWLDGHPEPSP